MKISVYTAIRNATILDFPIAEVLRHHLPLADEFVVLEGYSDDNTFDIVSAVDPKVRVIREVWDRSEPGAWWRNFKQKAKSHCTGDWCIFVDADEFIPEWEFDRVRSMIAATDKALIPVRLLNFYGNYKVLNIRPERIRWPVTKFVIHRNQPDIRFVGDGANVECDSCSWYEVPQDAVSLHHFGAVRHPARLRQKWRNDGQMKKKKASFDWLPSFVFDLMPHNWFDEDFMDDLATFEGPFVAAVREQPDRFTRDGMKVYEYLRKQGR
jgi:glycosyltransferase involved in cell wall biosynthesis